MTLNTLISNIVGPSFRNIAIIIAGTMVSLLVMGLVPSSVILGIAEVLFCLAVALWLVAVGHLIGLATLIDKKVEIPDRLPEDFK